MDEKTLQILLSVQAKGMAEIEKLKTSLKNAEAAAKQASAASVAADKNAARSQNELSKTIEQTSKSIESQKKKIDDLKAANDAMRAKTTGAAAAQKELAKANTSLATSQKQIAGLEEQLNKTLERGTRQKIANKDAANQLRSVTGQLNSAMNTLAQTQIKLQNTEQKLGEALAKNKALAQQYADTLNKLRQAEAEVQRLQSQNVALQQQMAASMQRSTANLAALGSAFTKVGQIMTVAFTAPITAGFAMVMKSGMDFEQAFAGVARTVGGSDKELEPLRQALRGMALEIPMTREAIAQVAETAGQLGIQKENIASFTDAMSRMGATTNMSADQAANSLAQLGNIFGTAFNQSQFATLASTITRLGVNAAATESQITTMAFRVAGAGRQVGMTIPQILAWSTAMASLGIRSELGGSAFSQVIAKISSAVGLGGDKLQAFASLAGMTAEQFSQAWKNDPNQVLQTLLGNLDAMRKSGQNVFPVLAGLGLNSIRVRDVIFRLAGGLGQVTNALGDANAEWGSTNTLMEQSNRKFQTVASQLTILKSKLTDIGVTLFDAFKPELLSGIGHVSDMLGGLGDAAAGFAKIDPAIQTAVVAFLGMLAVLGPVAIAIGSVVTAFSALAIIGVPLAPIIVPLAAALGIILAVGVAVAVLATNWDRFKTNFPGLATLITTTFTVLKFLLSALIPIAEAFGKALYIAIYTAMVVLDGLVHLLEKIVGTAWNVTVTVTKKLVGFGKDSLEDPTSPGGMALAVATGGGSVAAVLTLAAAKKALNAAVDEGQHLWMNDAEAQAVAVQRSNELAKASVEGRRTTREWEDAYRSYLKTAQSAFDVNKDGILQADELAKAQLFAAASADSAVAKLAGAASAGEQTISQEARATEQATARAIAATNAYNESRETLTEAGAIVQGALMQQQQQQLDDAKGTMIELAKISKDGGLGLVDSLISSIVNNKMSVKDAFDVLTASGRISMKDMNDAIAQEAGSIAGDLAKAISAGDEGGIGLASQRLSDLQDLMAQVAQNSDKFAKDMSLSAEQIQQSFGAMGADTQAHVGDLVNFIMSGSITMNQAFKMMADSGNISSAQLIHTLEGLSTSIRSTMLTAKPEDLAGLSSQLDIVNQMLERAKTNWDGLKPSMNGALEIYGRFDDAFSELSKQTARWTDIQGKATDAQKYYQDILDNGGTLTDQQTQNLKDVTWLAARSGDAIKGLGGETADATAAFARFTHAHDDLNAQYKAGKINLQQYNEALAEAASGLDPATAAFFDMTAAQSGVQAGIEGSIKELKALLIQLGLIPADPPAPDIKIRDHATEPMHRIHDEGGRLNDVKIEPSVGMNLKEWLRKRDNLHTDMKAIEDNPPKATINNDDFITKKGEMNDTLKGLGDPSKITEPKVGLNKTEFDTQADAVNAQLSAWKNMPVTIPVNISFNGSLPSGIGADNGVPGSIGPVPPIGPSIPPGAGGGNVNERSHARTLQGLDAPVVPPEAVQAASNQRKDAQDYADAISSVIGILGGVGKNLGEDGVKAAKEVADTAKACLDALTAAADFADKMGSEVFQFGDFQKANVTTLAQVTQFATQSLGDSAAMFGDDYLKHLKDYADSAKSAVDLLDATVDFVKKMGDSVFLYGKWQEANIAALKFISEFATVSVGDSAQMFASGYLSHLKDYAESAKSAVELLSATADFAKAMGDETFRYGAFQQDNIAALKFTSENAARSVGDSAAMFKDQYLTHLKDYSEAAKGAVDLLSATVDFSKKMGDEIFRYGKFQADNVAALKFISENAARSVGDSAQMFSDDYLTKLKNYTDAAGAALGLLSATVDLMKNLRDAAFKAKDYAIDYASIFADLAKIAQQALDSIQHNAHAWAGNKEKISDYAGAVKDSLDILNGVIDLLLALRDAALKAKDFSIDFELVFQQLAQIASMAVAAIDATKGDWSDAKTGISDFASVAKDSLDTLKAVVDILTALRDAAITADDLATNFPVLFQNLAVIAQEAAVAISEVKGDWSDLKTSMDDFNEVAKGSLETLKSVLDFLDAFGSTAEMLIDPSRVAQFAENLGTIARIVADAVNAASAGWADEVDPAFTAFNTDTQSSLDTLKGILDILDALASHSGTGVIVAGKINGLIHTLAGNIGAAVDEINQLVKTKPLAKGFGKWSEDAGKGVSLMKDIAESMKAIGETTIMSQKSVAAFVHNWGVILDLIRQLNVMAQGFIQDAVDFKYAAEQIAGALKAAAEAIQTVTGDMAKPADNQNVSDSGGSSSSGSSSSSTPPAGSGLSGDQFVGLASSFQAFLDFIASAGKITDDSMNDMVRAVSNGVISMDQMFAALDAAGTGSVGDMLKSLDSLKQKLVDDVQKALVEGTDPSMALKQLGLINDAILHLAQETLDKLIVAASTAGVSFEDALKNLTQSTGLSVDEMIGLLQALEAELVIGLQGALAAGTDPSQFEKNIAIIEGILTKLHQQVGNTGGKAGGSSGGAQSILGGGGGLSKQQKSVIEQIVDNINGGNVKNLPQAILPDVLSEVQKRIKDLYTQLALAIQTGDRKTITASKNAIAALKLLEKQIKATQMDAKALYDKLVSQADDRLFAKFLKILPGMKGFGVDMMDAVITGMLSRGTSAQDALKTILAFDKNNQQKAIASLVKDAQSLMSDLFNTIAEGGDPTKIQQRLNAIIDIFNGMIKSNPGLMNSMPGLQDLRDQLDMLGKSGLLDMQDLQKAADDYVNHADDAASSTDELTKSLAAYVEAARAAANANQALANQPPTVSSASGSSSIAGGTTTNLTVELDGGVLAESTAHHFKQSADLRVRMVR